MKDDKKIDPDFGAPPDVKQVLWLDVRTQLPVRWEMVVDGVPTAIALSFVHVPSNWRELLEAVDRLGLVATIKTFRTRGPRLAIRQPRGRLRPTAMWIATSDLPITAAHPLYDLVNRILDDAGFAAFVEAQCAPFYDECLAERALNRHSP